MLLLQELGGHGGVRVQIDVEAVGDTGKSPDYKRVPKFYTLGP